MSGTFADARPLKFKHSMSILLLHLTKRSSALIDLWTKYGSTENSIQSVFQTLPVHEIPEAAKLSAWAGAAPQSWWLPTCIMTSRE